MTAHIPARRGWRVMAHAVERFVERVASVRHDEAFLKKHGLTEDVDRKASKVPGWYVVPYYG